MEEFHDVAVFIDQVLGEVPADLCLWECALQELVQGARVVPNDVDFSEHG
eukprot:CAMPEP_0185582214 /NCGR_PEP_ID=MMETSP0434-20130131/20167_1 /TAXON_ID=626734 ORGANISM="Favella taraikaensis, Strain Fe Narragansett Bay" /NCGR_SAMPLE_ID=MMETSP0434 /ASSEMBLY_ACC=CAM_ASM_000379 /LENGTH=49 /DNA_ID=CAMNT_0028200977 /DNA_START=297 /DNA_END=446 /DNA_ORIENTATION=-